MIRKVPAFGWPPGFLNTGTLACVFIGPGGAIYAASPNIESVVANGIGDYLITLKYGIGLAWTQSGTGSPRLTSVQPQDPEAKTWQLLIWDVAGNPADGNIGVWFSGIPFSWYQI